MNRIAQLFLRVAVVTSALYVLFAFIGPLLFAFAAWALLAKLTLGIGVVYFILALIFGW